MDLDLQMIREAEPISQRKKISFCVADVPYPGPGRGLDAFGFGVLHHVPDCRRPGKIVRFSNWRVYYLEELYLPLQNHHQTSSSIPKRTASAAGI
jgi:hypothetical protein